MNNTENTYIWHIITDGKLPVSDKKVLLSTTTYGIIIGYYDIEDEAFFILSGAEPRILHNEIIAWAEIPECNIKKPITNFRLPSREEFNRLCECYTKFDNKERGRWFYDEETGGKLFLPCEGYLYNEIVNYIDSGGYYWSSTYSNNTHAYNLEFSNSYIDPNSNTYHYNGRSIRLVSDEPFEGAVHVAGLYWKKENEQGYFTYDEAIKKFNK